MTPVSRLVATATPLALVILAIAAELWLPGSSIPCGLFVLGVAVLIVLKTGWGFRYSPHDSLWDIVTFALLVFGIILGFGMLRLGTVSFGILMLAAAGAGALIMARQGYVRKPPPTHRA